MQEALLTRFLSAITLIRFTEHQKHTILLAVSEGYATQMEKGSSVCNNTERGPVFAESITAHRKLQVQATQGVTDMQETKQPLVYHGFRLELIIM